MPGSGAVRNAKAAVGLPRLIFGRSLPRLNWDRGTAIALIIPSVLAIGVFVYGFIGWSALVSVSAWDQLRPDYTFVGLSNFKELFNNFRFQADIRNMVVFTLFFIVSSLIIGLILAILLDRRIRGENLFRSIFLFPMAISFIVTGVVWRWLLVPRAGVNVLLDNAGLDFLENNWYTDPTVFHISPDSGFGNFLDTFGLGFLASSDFGIPVAMFSIIIAATWQMSGFIMVLYLAGLRAIPEELKEAARVDGANEFQVVRYIDLPLLRPITLSAMIILGHISLKIFDLIFVMTPNGGPGFSTDVPALFMFTTTFQGNNFARGASISIVMLIAISLLVIPYLVWSLRREARL